MSGSLGFSDGNEPIGYVCPEFPALSFDLSENPYTSPLLFKGWDIYRFTVYWFLIFAIGFHVLIVVVATVIRMKTQRIKLQYFLITVIAYGATGAFYGFVLGSFSGLLLGAIYRAGALHMSTWVPFTWALALMLLTAFSSYEQSSIDI